MTKLDCFLHQWRCASCNPLLGCGRFPYGAYLVYIQVPSGFMDVFCKVGGQSFPVITECLIERINVFWVCFFSSCFITLKYVEEKSLFQSQHFSFQLKPIESSQRMSHTAGFPVRTRKRRLNNFVILWRLRKGKKLVETFLDFFFSLNENHTLIL